MTKGKRKLNGNLIEINFFSLHIFFVLCSMDNNNNNNNKEKRKTKPYPNCRKCFIFYFISKMMIMLSLFVCYFNNNFLSSVFFSFVHTKKECQHIERFVCLFCFHLSRELFMIMMMMILFRKISFLFLP